MAQSEKSGATRFWNGFLKIAGTVCRLTGRTIRTFLTWQWTKQFLYWLILSGGTVSELAFLIASLWMSVNASVHSFVLLFISEEWAKWATELATTAYVALPEVIAPLAVVTTLARFFAAFYHGKKDWKACCIDLLWGALYLFPTVVFIGLSVLTLAGSVSSVDFRLPQHWAVARALAGYMFAFTSLLYMQLGLPQERQRLKQKDAMLADLRTELGSKIAKLESETGRLNQIIDSQKAELQSAKRQQEALLKVANKSNEDALQAYSNECKKWLKSGVKTAEVDEITRYTGHTRRKIQNAVEAGKLGTAPRNKDRILMSSLPEWLANNLPNAKSNEPETGPLLQIVNG